MSGGQSGASTGDTEDVRPSAVVGPSPEFENLELAAVAVLHPLIENGVQLAVGSGEIASIHRRKVLPLFPRIVESECMGCVARGDFDRVDTDSAPRLCHHRD